MIDLIDREIEAARASVSADTIKFINIDSTLGAAEAGAPFGRGVQNVLDTAIEMADKDGFFTKDYKVGVAHLALKDGQPDLGIWIHGDVVTVGDGWDFEPFNGVEFEGCVIGRGAGDNKGQLAAMYNLLKIFKKLGIELKYNPAIFIGSNEENGVRDILGDDSREGALGYINVATPPKLSLVPDCGFPVGYGGKGKSVFVLRSRNKFNTFKFSAGQKATPWKAFAEFDVGTNLPETLPKCTVDGNIVWTESQSRHGSNPDPEGNMITKLSSALLGAGLVPEENIDVMKAFRELTLDTEGEALGIKIPHPIMGTPRVFIARIDFNDGYPEIEISIRNPLSVKHDFMDKAIREYAEKNGFDVVKSEMCIEPYMNDPDSEIVRELCDISNKFIGSASAPYIVGGVTYAHTLPNAYPFGSSSNVAPKSFKPGRGAVHGIDESVSLDCLQRAMKIYARALLKLNEIEW